MTIEPPEPCFFHHAQYGPGHIEGRVEAGVDHEVPVVVRELIDRPRAADARVVEKDVDAPEAINRLGHDSITGLGASQIREH